MSRSIFISVRSNSSRLPKKATRQIVGKPTIFYLIDSLKKSQHADNIILCTTERDEDTELCDIATENGIAYFRINEHPNAIYQESATYQVVRAKVAQGDSTVQERRDCAWR